jgi:hypothetical protein
MNGDVISAQPKLSASVPSITSLLKEQLSRPFSM